MSFRLPSARQLDRLSAVDQMLVLDALERELHDVHAMLLDGRAEPYRGTRRAALAASRIQIRRFNLLAQAFGYGVSAA